MKNVCSLFLIFGLISSASVGTQDALGQNWNVDSKHSVVSFKIKHFFTPVSGKFQDYDAQIAFDPADLANSSIAVTIQAASIDTDHESRDKDLRSDNFFNAEVYPTITFTSSSIELTSENEFVANGKLKIKDVEKDFALPFTLLGTGDTGRGVVAGFEANTAINRNDFGIGTGKWVETTVLSNEVKIHIAIEARQAVADSKL